jgi:hypothetical protein
MISLRTQVGSSAPDRRGSRSLCCCTQAGIDYVVLEDRSREYLVGRAADAVLSYEKPPGHHGAAVRRA